MNRRRFLGIGASVLGTGALAAVAAPAAARLLVEGRPGRLLRSELDLPEAFQVPLPVPAVLQPVRSDGTGDHYEITQQVAGLEILPGVRTEAWTFGGTYPGPTVVARSGRPAVVTHRNRLPTPTVVHLHGGHTPADSDGYPMDLVLPVGSPAPGRTALGHAMPGMEGTRASGRTVVGERAYTYPGRQRAATLWYHDHRMGFTGPSVWRGLAGFHLVHDDEEEALPLPRGDRDLPLMLADRSFAEDGSFRYPSAGDAPDEPGVTDAYANGVLGDVILVNGAPWPRLDVDRAHYRLRLLNASNARPYRLELDPQPSDGDALVQIGSDGGLLAAPVAHDAIEIAPAERFDVVVDFSRYAPGTRVRLMNRFGRGRTAEVMCFDVSSRSAGDDARVPDRLSDIEELDASDAVATRDFAFRLSHREGGWIVNGRLYEPGDSLAAPALGAVERWRFSSDAHHPVHVHLDQFQVIGRNGRGPGPWDAGWKDTVDLRPAEAVEVLVRFTDYAGTYQIHCHNLEHEDMAMMADFTVV